MFQVRYTHVRSRPVLGAVRFYVVVQVAGMCLGGSGLTAQETDIPPPVVSPPVVAPPVIPSPDVPAGGMIRIQTDTPPVPPPGDAGLPPVLEGEQEDEDESFPVPDPGKLIEAVDLPPSEVQLIVGRSRLFRLTRPLSADTLITYDNDGVIEVQPLTDPEARDLRFLNVIGVGFGRATVRLIDQERNLVQTLEAVVSIDEAALEERINTILEGSDITVRQVAQNVILEGQVANSKVMADVLELVRSELRLSGQAAVGSVASDLGFSAEEPALGTPVPPAAASPSGVQPGLVVVNRVKVRGPRQVMLKVKIAEINRTGLRQLGVNFQRLTDGTNINSIVGGVAGVTEFQPLLGIEQLLFADPLDTQLFGIFNDGDFRLYLNALRQNDLVRILAQPTLMTLDGQPARFLAGGSFPFPVPQIGIGGVATITIEFRDFGALLEFLPTILEDDSIRLDVQPIFSELNQNTGIAVAGTAVPGLTERSARTVVQLREGQTLAIAGLFSTRTNGSTQRIPLLGDIPVVGPLFSRNVIQTNETELIVLVTPELVEPVEAQAAPGPGELYQEPNDLEFFFLGRLEGKTRHPHRSTINYLDPFQVMKHFQSEDQWVVGPHGFAD
ncbi:type II and III secretion system protein family protein [Tautonia rosea]|uniref:type II and III secretion system protein family protein n=1 Tax=Tautonia rosea TaxID=2728037 RepID=UPI00147558E4|nr:pilus assembly protein CpaC [Tautonia rosea]